MLSVVLDSIGQSTPFKRKILMLEDGNSIKLGRAACEEQELTSNGRFYAQQLSERHAILTNNGGRLFIRDVHQRGTFLNGQRLVNDRSYRVDAGDVIELGKASFFSEGHVDGVMAEIDIFKSETSELSRSLIHYHARIENSFLTLYLSPPTFKTTIENFLKWMDCRYKVLQILADSESIINFQDAKWITSTVCKIKTCGLKDFYSLITCSSVEGVKKELQTMDQVSHFALRMACSRYFETIRWFIRQEIKLLHIRWFFLNPLQKKIFLHKNHIDPYKVSKEEEYLISKSYGWPCCMNSGPMFKVKYEGASELVTRRNTFVYSGWVFLPADSLIYPVATFYSQYLNHSLLAAKKRISIGEVYDVRVTPAMRRLATEIKDYFCCLSSFTSRICMSADEIEELSVQSFPLCMEVLYFNLKRNNHLRNGGRFQLNLFLKGIGLPLNEALAFWRHFFTKKMSLDKFLSKYTYFIRHGYGKLGKQANYPPLGCSKILDMIPGPNEYHGCPFSQRQRNNLEVNLKRNLLSSEEVDELMGFVRSGQPTSACARMFEIKHSVKDQSPTAHPNYYFERSRKIHQAKLKQMIEPSVEELEVKGKSSQANKNDGINNLIDNACHCNIKKYEW